MPFVDPNTVHNPATGTVAPATWGDTVRDDLVYLADPPVCSVFNSASVSTTNGVTTVLAANSEQFDNDAMHSTVTNNSRITIQTDGRYLVTALVRFLANATGGRHLGLLVNGTTNHDLMAVRSHDSGFDTFLSGSKSFAFTGGDFVEVRATQHSGGALNVTLEDFTVMFLTI